MSNLLSRSQFYEETGSLFTDEKTANARSKIVEWINETALADAAKKCEIISKVQEMIVGSCIELLDEFWENIIAMVHDQNGDVRKAVIGFIEQICKEKIEYLPRVTNVISMLIRDSSPQVIKRVIQASCSIYKNGLQWICTSAEMTDSVELAWTTLSLIKAQVLDLIDNENDGIRTNAIKFLEVVVILQTYPDEDSLIRDNDFSLNDVPLTLKLVRRRKLEDEAANIFDILLKFHGTIHISSVNLIACTSSLCTIAKMRPALMAPVIEAINHLNSNLPPTLTDSQVNSVRKSLKMQLINLLKNRGSFEFHSTIKEILLDLGASQNEINRAVPKMDKQEVQKRQKRILESSGSGNITKRPRLNEPQSASEEESMDVDSTPSFSLSGKEVGSEKNISDSLQNVENVVQLVISNIKNLPTVPPPYFLSNYATIRSQPIPQHILIARLICDQLNDTVEQAEVVAAKSASQIQADLEGSKELENQRKEEATKKLRETMERAKGEAAVIQRMKQRAKTLKLQEVTKPLSRSTMDKFLLDTIKRIFECERQCAIGGVAAKRRKLLTVMAATFPDNVRHFIYYYIMADLKPRIDLAFSWLYEEYCLLQGFTRHSYVKSENRPDYAYTTLLGQIIKGIIEKCDFKDKINLIRRVYMESPLLSDDSLKQLVDLCTSEDMSSYSIDLVKDLAIMRPPKKQHYVLILLNFCVHENITLRDKALECIISLYTEQKIMTGNIEEFAILWIRYLEQETPPVAMFKEEYGRPTLETTWKEELTKSTLTLALSLMPYHGSLLQVLTDIYISTSADHKRTILRSIEMPIKKMGAESSEILRLINECPKGAETLITRIIYILTERSAPTPELVAKVRELHQTKFNDVRLFIPVLSGLTKQEILNALPKLLKLNPIVVKEVFNRLLGIGAEFANHNMPISPSEILVALHTLDTSKCELKFVVKATSLCLAEKDVYTQEILGACLQQLVEVTPLPTLLMRTVIQSLSLYPRLSPFIVNLLQRLILKQVWKQKVIWDGFLKCSQRLKPHSLPVLIQLPAQQLSDALAQCPDLRPPLLEYAQNITESQVGHISSQIMDILTGNAVDVFVTDESGGYISVENIKKEVGESTDKLTQIGQPLPPGSEF